MLFIPEQNFRKCFNKVGKLKCDLTAMKSKLIHTIFSIQTLKANSMIKFPLMFRKYHQFVSLAFQSFYTSIEHLHNSSFVLYKTFITLC